MDYKKVIASLDYFAEGLTGQMVIQSPETNINRMIGGANEDERGKEK